MKKLFFLFVLGFAFSGAAMAQPAGDNQPPKENIIEKLIAFEMTKRLNLSTEEAQKFWPVFNLYQNEWRTAVKNNKDDEIKRTEAVLNVQKKFKPDFQRVLNSEERANRVYKIHREIIERIKNQVERRQERRQNNPAPRLERRGGRLM